MSIACRSGRDDRCAAVSRSAMGEGRHQAVAAASSAPRSSWCRKSATTCWAMASPEFRAHGRRRRAVERVGGQSTGTATILVDQVGRQLASSSSRARTAISVRRTSRGPRRSQTCDLTSPSSKSRSRRSMRRSPLASGMASERCSIRRGRFVNSISSAPARRACLPQRD